MQGYSHGRGIESSKKKIRIGVHHLLLAVLALTLLILFFSARLIQINSVGVSALDGELSPEVQHYDVRESKDSNNVTSNDNNGASDGKNSFHFIVSSDCTSYQRWETLTQLHSAQSIQQCGRFTWIVSGWYVMFLSITICLFHAQYSLLMLLFSYHQSRGGFWSSRKRKGGC